MGVAAITLLRQWFCNDKLAVWLFFVQGGESDAHFAAFPVLHGSKTQSDALLVYDETFIHIFITAQKNKVFVKLISSLIQ